MNLSGHVWTVGSLLKRVAFPVEAPPGQNWTTTLEDESVGTVRLTGRLSSLESAREVVILVHGLGGTSESEYMKQAARAAARLGLASLRLNLRGADGNTGDFYHGGLTADLFAAIRDLAPRFERFTALGFSLGGHVALRSATEADDGGPHAVAAICSPLELAAGVDSIDRPVMAPYRRYVLDRLKANYADIARLRTMPTDPAIMRRVDKLREWDSLTVVPRFGFRDTQDYYRRASVGPLLDNLRRPALLVATEHDPMIPPTAIRPSLGRHVGGSHLEIRWLTRGGHMALPRRADLQLDALDPPDRFADPLSQVLQWLSSRASDASDTPRLRRPEAPSI